MGLFSCFGRIILDIAVLLVILLVLPGIPPHVSYSYYEPDKTLDLEGPLAKNDLLNDAGRILDGKIIGPESIASRDRHELFTSLHNGKILRVWGRNFDHFQPVITIGPGCDGPWQEKICGRPLGLRFAHDGRLLVADAYLGMFAVDVDTGKKERLIDPSVEIDGAVPKITNSVDIDEDGNLYWTDSSSVVDLSDGLVEMLSNPSGRLIKYDSKLEKNIVLLKDLHFANGVQLSPDRDFVLVAETFKSRVLRHWLNGPNAGKTEVFVDRLPGKPDNIKPRKNGGYYISLIAVDNKEKVDGLSVLARLPFLRKLILRLLALPKFMFDTISKYYPNEYTENFSYKIYHLLPIAEIIASPLTIVVELDEEGNIISSFQGDNGIVRFISEAVQVGDYLFLGSPYNHYLGYLRIEYTDEDEEDLPAMEVDGEGVKMREAEEKAEEEVDAKVDSKESESEPKVQEDSPVKKDQKIEEAEEPKEPVKEAVTEQPVKEEITEQPVKEAVTEQPVKEEITEQPVKEPVTEQPVKEEITEQPVKEAVTEQPVKEEITEQPVKDASPDPTAKVKEEL